MLSRSIARILVALFAGVVVTSSVQRAEAMLSAFDDFDYDAVGSDLTGNSGGGSFGFSGSWDGQTSYNVGSGSLTSPVDPLFSIGNRATAVAFGENRDIDRTFEVPLGADGTSAYVSVLMRPEGILHQGANSGWFGLVLRGTTFVSIGMNFDRNKYGLRYADVYHDSSLTPVVGQPVFLVLRIDFTEGVDPARLYVNPNPGAPEPTTASASIIDLGIENITKLSLSGPGAASFDAIRIGPTYADVAPPAADFDGDLDVDGNDLAAWQSNFGVGETHAAGDADRDNDVDGRDFLIWQREAGYPHAPTDIPTVQTVPESATALLLGLGLATIAFGRRRTC
jgi:hypothetical protein